MMDFRLTSAVFCKRMSRMPDGRWAYEEPTSVCYLLADRPAPATKAVVPLSQMLVLDLCGTRGRGGMANVRIDAIDPAGDRQEALYRGGFSWSSKTDAQRVTLSLKGSNVNFIGDGIYGFEISVGGNLLTTLWMPLVTATETSVGVAAPEEVRLTNLAVCEQVVPRIGDSNVGYIGPINVFVPTETRGALARMNFVLVMDLLAQREDFHMEIDCLRPDGFTQSPLWSGKVSPQSAKESRVPTARLVVDLTNNAMETSGSGIYQLTVHAERQPLITLGLPVRLRS
jgi:hypothetical protein